MHWHILGVGAMGGLFARRLHAMGFDVTLLSRQKAPITARQALPFAHDAPGSTPSFEVSWVQDQMPIQQLLVCTKAFATVAAVSAIADRLTADACVVLLGNGMGYHEQVASSLASQTLLAGTTTAACYRTVDASTGAHLWHLASEGETTLGNLNGAPPPAWFEAFTRQPWTCHWSNRVGDFLLNKLVINAVINPPTALYDIDNGALLSAPFHSEFEAAIAEVAALVAACGETNLANQLGVLARGVAKHTAANTSSMRADMKNGRQTEVEAILGYLLEQLPQRIGAHQPIPATPILSEWLHKLRNRERVAQ